VRLSPTSGGKCIFYSRWLLGKPPTRKAKGEAKMLWRREGMQNCISSLLKCTRRRGGRGLVGGGEKEEAATREKRRRWRHRRRSHPPPPRPPLSHHPPAASSPAPGGGLAPVGKEGNQRGRECSATAAEQTGGAGLVRRNGTGMCHESPREAEEMGGAEPHSWLRPPRRDRRWKTPRTDRI
jgi:hypothetical protein